MKINYIIMSLCLCFCTTKLKEEQNKNTSMSKIENNYVDTLCLLPKDKRKTEIENNYVDTLTLFDIVLSEDKIKTEIQNLKSNHPLLIKFYTKPLMEDLPNKMSKNEKKYKNDRTFFFDKIDTVLYKQDTLYISHIARTNCCSIYDGNLIFKMDSLELQNNNVSGYECGCSYINRFVYVIYNPKNKKFKIKKHSSLNL